MDDLAGLDWSSNAKKTNPAPFPTLRPSPSPSNSGTSTPLNLPQPGNPAFNRPLRPPSKPATPSNDPFASSLSIGSKPAQDTRSLQERQQALVEEKARKAAQDRKQFESHFGAGGAHLDSLGQNGSTSSSRAATPSTYPTPSIAPPGNKPKSPFGNVGGPASTLKRAEQDDDILAAFNSSAPVDASSHFPPPSQGQVGRSTPAAQTSTQDVYNFDDDDDPFGLNKMSNKQTGSRSREPVSTSNNDKDDDDILGMLGKPVSEVKKQTQKSAPSRRVERLDSTNGNGSPEDKAVVELVDMGFTAEKAAIALAQTDSGYDVQAAVGILLTQAHTDSKQKAQRRPERSPPGTQEDGRSRRRNQDNREDKSVPAWMREGEPRASSGSRNRDDRSPAGEKDAAQYAQEIGSSLFKSANSLWKAGQKKVQKAIAEYDGNPDSSQPKWMRDAQLEEAAAKQRPDGSSRGKSKQAEQDLTDEAARLEAGERPQAPPRKARQEPNSHFADELPPRPRQDRVETQARRRTDELLGAQTSRPASATRMTRQDLEDQTPQSYVSPARRRRGTPDPSQALSEPSRSATSSPLSTSSPPVASRNPFHSAVPPTQKAPVSRPVSKPATPIPTRPKAPLRKVPPVDASALALSARHRTSGTEAFKRGDYAQAHDAYTSAMRSLPQNHPIVIVILCNRALTGIKTGDAKAAVADADSALAIIGPSNGEDEKIAITDSSGLSEDKEMKEFFGKALMRKAEGLEHLERWSDAAKAWRAAVEAGVGGAVSIHGRNRCEKASGEGGSKQSSCANTPKPQPAAARRPPPRPKPSALSDLGQSTGSSDAVQKLRAQHAAQSAEEDEKFALTDAVDAKLVAWKGTKKDNLRALLGSLDVVMWPEAGWKKVGMNELVQPSRVKIVYMKAIARVHPDKVSSLFLFVMMQHRLMQKQIPSNATTEQKMISAAVFATLNEAWDKFKADNGL